MSSATWDASEVGELGNDLVRAAVTVYRRNIRTVHDAGERVERGWRTKATVTAGSHGKHYPRSIEAKGTGDLEATIEPKKGMRQAAMAFEYGGPSVISNPNPGWFPTADGWRRGGFAGQRVGQSAPHLDMNLTMDVEDPRFVKEVREDALPWW